MLRMNYPELAAKPALKSLTTNQERLLTLYTEAVVKANDLLHLTSERDKPFFRQRHVDDAIALLQHLPEAITATSSAKVLDVGTGNGIPGLILAILCPQWQVDLLDSSNKKCLFLDTFINNNAINNARVYCTRAEELARTGHRESYNFVFCRALEKLPTALELTIPFAKVGGLVIVSHGTSWNEEHQRSQNALKLLESELETSIPYSIEGKTDLVTLLIRKKAPTLPRYPRNVGIPTKRPL